MKRDTLSRTMKSRRVAQSVPAEQKLAGHIKACHKNKVDMSCQACQVLTSRVVVEQARAKS